MKSLENAAVSGKKVLIRIGADVPLSDDSVPKILDDSRLRSLLPTLHYLLNRQAKIVLMAHLGRPGGKVEKRLSLRPVYLRLSALLERPITFAPSLFSDRTRELIDSMAEQQIVGLENVRFEPGEENNSRTFARKLSQYGELYVNEAFSVAHHSGASTVAITEFLPSYAGLSFEQEIKMLSNLLRHPARPFVVVIGGVKISDKLPALLKLLQHADRILVAGGVANTLLKARGDDIKDSTIDEAYLPQARTLLKRAGSKLVLPTDFRWQDNKILDVGEVTLERFLHYLKGAKTVFWNGCLGKTEVPEFAESSEILAHYLAQSPATTVVGGGNTIEVLARLHLRDKVSFVSMGGGATLGLLGGQELPGLRALQ